MINQQNRLTGLKLESGQFAVIHIETATGILLNLDGARNLGTEIEYLVFTEIDKAVEYAQNKVDAEPDIECIVYDSDFSPIVVFQNGLVPNWIRHSMR